MKVFLFKLNFSIIFVILFMFSSLEILSQNKIVPIKSNKTTSTNREDNSKNKKLIDEINSLKLEIEKNNLEKTLLISKLEKSFKEKNLEIHELNKKNQLEELRLKKLKNERIKQILDLEHEVKLINQNRLKQEALMKKELDEKTHEIVKKNQEIEVKRKLLESEYKLKVNESKLELLGLSTEVSKLKSQIEKINKAKDRSNYSNSEPIYLEKPFDKKNGLLVISDRRIPLNGPILQKTANFISHQINYFNNKSEKFPIFIVIDYSPGGSVLAGLRILKAMESSKAPVYVVVKTFAASMAATLATLAEDSFAYPNAILLHHQMLSYRSGNVSELRDQMKDNSRMWKRLAGPIAKKMNITIEQFVEKMYENYASGDWREYADKAKELKWINNIADKIHETSISNKIITNKENLVKPKIIRTSSHLQDFDKKGYYKLPKLRPMDSYYLYDPANESINN